MSDILVGSADLLIYTPGIGTIIRSLWEKLAFVHFAAVIANHCN